MTGGVADSPIGVFDSGIGGLTVVKELIARLSRESIVYLGDTARVPYGTKSSRTVIRYSLSNARFLVPRGVKVIVVACNTASAVALPALREAYDIPVVGVIDPGATRAAGLTRSGRVGVIGTPSTIRSGAYQEALLALDPSLEVHALACPLFVALADEGLSESGIARMAARMYLEPMAEKDIDVLILGCTHYPLLKPVIAEVMGPRVTLVDSAEATAEHIALVLAQESIEAGAGIGDEPVREFYLTDVSDTFVRVAQRFLGRKIEHIDQVDIGPGTP